MFSLPLPLVLLRDTSVNKKFMNLSHTEGISYVTGNFIEPIRIIDYK